MKNNSSLLVWFFQLHLFISDPVQIIDDIKKYASSEGLTLEEYLMWTVDNNLSSHFLNLLFQVSSSSQSIASSINIFKNSSRTNAILFLCDFRFAMLFLASGHSLDKRKVLSSMDG